MSSHNLRGTAHRQPLICFFSYRFVTLVFKIGFYCISLLILMFYQYMLIIHKMGFNTTFSYMYIMYLDHIQPLFSCSSIPVPLTLFFLPTSFYFHVSFFFFVFFFLPRKFHQGCLWELREALCMRVWAPYQWLHHWQSLSLPTSH